MKMFHVKNLYIHGSAKQVEQYASDAKEYDYIKNSIEKIMYTIKTKCNNVDNYKKLARICPSLYLTAHSRPYFDNNPYFLIYDAKTKTYTNHISVDQLSALKNPNNVDYITEQLLHSKNYERMIPNYMNDLVNDLISKSEDSSDFDF